MIATALRIANVHPIFRYLVIEPPRWAYRAMRRVSRDGSGFAPALLGFLTVFMPCGITQATMAVAVASGNPWTGAAIMFAFILGTSPIFFLLGATILSLLKRRVFAYAASAIVVLFAVLSINGGLCFKCARLFTEVLFNFSNHARKGDKSGDFHIFDSNIKEISKIIGTRWEAVTYSNLFDEKIKEHS